MKIINYAFTLLLFAFFANEAHAQSYNPVVPGVVINHSPASTGKYIGSPSIVVMPNGDYVASHDYFGPGGGRGSWNQTLVYRSTDKGKSWKHLTTIDNQWWSTLFYHNNGLYLIGTYGRMNNAVIRKSEDGGKTWTNPNDKQSGLLAEGRYHCAPVPVVRHDGRLWRAMEYAPQGRDFEAFMMSVPIDANLLEADNWTFTNKIPYNEDWYDGRMRSWLEGNAVVTPNGEMVNILRCAFSDDTRGVAAVVRVNEKGTKSTFDPGKGFIRLPGGTGKKFTIRYDEESQKYWSLVNWVQPKDVDTRERNTVALVSSPDLKTWTIERVILHHPDPHHHAFQYLDWQFEGNDIIAVSRTAYDDGLGGAANYHDANYMTFHRIEHFRESFNLETRN